MHCRQYQYQDFHQFLVSFIEGAGFNLEKSGVCLGYAMKGLHAAMCGEIGFFSSRVDFIYKNPYLQHTVKWIYDSMGTQPPDGVNTQFRCYVNLNPWIWDILALVEGMVLHVKPENYSHIFSSDVTQQSVETIAMATVPVSIEEQQGLQRVDSWPGIYTRSELKALLGSLLAAAQKTRQNIALNLKSENHSVSLYYDKNIHGWHVINADWFPIPFIPNDRGNQRNDQDLAEVPDRLVNAIFAAFFSEHDEFVALETSVLSLGINRLACQNMVEQVKSSEDFALTHDITEEKARRKTLNRVSLASIAAQHGYHAVITRLGSLNSDLDSPQSDGNRPVHLAAKFRHAETIKALGRAGAKLDLTGKAEMTPAMLTAQAGDIATLLALHQSGVNVNKKSGSGLTLAHLAAKSGHALYLLKLHELGAKVDESTQSGMTPAVVAAASGKISVLRALKQCGVDLGKTAPCGVNPMQAAADADQKKTVRFLSEISRQNKLHHHSIFRQPVHAVKGVSNDAHINLLGK
ncbi:hypothetical protein AQUSIP_00400 [Aquicella siphonis]|uniref:Uncharacterized protein n=1 Tax=Aquicella siphonis TaxID=254247 RepID=A0A5E4PE56_9COXI|nr:ankyrin repeat domain-containing protein [Aquicella siphonis]VVC74768.1 hypothetical protein AQUSIP_00400 [Aquicella siphonis]